MPAPPASPPPSSLPDPAGQLLKDMILGALVAKGGQAYLEERAEANPVAFMSLVAKVLPAVLKGSGEDGGLRVVVRRLGGGDGDPPTPDTGTDADADDDGDAESGA